MAPRARPGDRRPARPETVSAAKDGDHGGADGTSATGRASQAPASAAGAEATAEGIYASIGHGGDDDNGQLGRNVSRRDDSRPQRSQRRRGASVRPFGRRHANATANARPGDERNDNAQPGAKGIPAKDIGQRTPASRQASKFSLAQ